MSTPPFDLPLPVSLRPFEYLPEVDCFITAQPFGQVASYLGLAEWTPVVWMGRYFTLDNDYGEHWFDNWPERAAICNHPLLKLRALDETELFVIDPDRHANGQDGPCHPADLRKKFWTEVFKSLEFSLDFLITEARFTKSELEKLGFTEAAVDNYLPDLESRIELILGTAKLLK